MSVPPHEDAASTSGSSDPEPQWRRPFTDVASQYLDAGWWPIPVSDEGGKSGIPSGVTGYNGRGVTGADVDRWSRERPAANVALRLPPDVIAIDVDHYSQKPGGLTLDKLEAELGQLPPTWVATARELPSGKRLYRVPPGTRLASTMGPGIDVCQHHHRYVVVAPSVHHTGAVVRWLDSASDEDFDRIPEPGDLPELPWAWIERFSVSGMAEVGPAASPRQVTAWQEGASEERAPMWINNVLAQVERAAVEGNSRHDRMLRALCAATREAQAGAYSAERATAKLRALWERLTSGEGRQAEFDTMLAWAVGQLETDAAAEKVEEIRRRLSTPRPSHSSASEPRLPEPKLMTDAEVAASFGDFIKGRFLFCAELGGWMHWDGGTWRRDVVEQIFEVARRYIIDLGKQLLETDADGSAAKKAVGYRSKSRIDAVVTIARRLDHIAVRADAFDRHPHLLNSANGVIDLRTGALEAHSPDLLLTKNTGVEYHPEARHQDVEAVLAVVDPETRDWLQVAMGYAATGCVSEDLLVVLDGQGSNGKTTLLRAVSAALGEYASPAPQRLLMKSATEEHPTLIADLHGHRLVTVEETAEGGALRIETIKMLTGGSQIKARFIARDYFEFAPTHQLILATNHRPAVNATDHATWRRLRLVEFPYRYTDPKQQRPGDRPIDRGLRERLTQDHQRQATLAWIVAGAGRWYSSGLPDSPSIDAATEAWRRSEDVILRYAQDRLVFEPSATTSHAALYSDYGQWCESEGRPPKSSKELIKQFEHHDHIVGNQVTRKKRSVGQVWIGMGLRGGDGGDARLDVYA